MKYKINQSRLYTLAYKYILDELGELSDLNLRDEIGELGIFTKNGKEVALLIYLPQMKKYLLKIDDDLYDQIMRLFLINDEEVGEILRKLIYDLTGAEVEMIQTFEK